jgi:hypothetical protein
LHSNPNDPERQWLWHQLACRKFEACNNVGVDEISGDASDEDVAELLVEHQLRRRAAVDAPRSQGTVLVPSRSRELGKEVAVNASTSYETRVVILLFPQRAARIKESDPY